MAKDFRDHVAEIIGWTGLRDLEEAGFMVIRKPKREIRICSACGHEIKPGTPMITHKDGTWEHAWDDHGSYCVFEDEV